MKYLITSIIAVLLSTTPVSANSDIECLARAIHHEAQGESELGKKAVGFVIVNRSKSKYFPNDICSVVTQPKQFTGFSLSKYIPVSTMEYYKKLASNIILSYNNNSDPTKGALYFHNRSVNPRWKLKYIITIGKHLYYGR
jgi:spore germination cell wall hydrolase CwlJ-like protein